MSEERKNMINKNNEIIIKKSNIEMIFLEGGMYEMGSNENLTHT